MEKFKPFYPQLMATGVGSLPYTGANEALKLIWGSVPDAPHWPQLPRQGAESSFIGQYLKVLIETGVIGDYEQPRFQVEEADWTERITKFYELYLAAEAGNEDSLAEFAFGTQGGEGFDAFCADLEQNGIRQAILLKGQLSGPLTLGLQITDKNRRSSYYDETQRELLVKALAFHAEWQTRRLRKFGLPVLMTIDDPGLYAFGASTHVTLERDTIIRDLNTIADKIAAAGGIPGVHVCAGMDWTLIFDSNIQVLNFDAYEYMTSMQVLAGPLNSYLERGGVVSWGIVPTQEQVWQENADSLRLKLEEGFSELAHKGVDAARLRRQSMLTPSCGTGTLTKETAERVYHVLAELTGVMREKGLPVFSL